MESIIDSLITQVADFNNNYGDEVLVINTNNEKPSLSIILKDVDFRIRLDFKSDISKKVSIYNCKYNVILRDAPGIFNKFITDIKSEKELIELVQTVRMITERFIAISDNPSEGGSEN